MTLLSGDEDTEVPTRRHGEEDNPFVGPRPFEYDLRERRLFHGRTRDASTLESLIRSHPIVLLYAPSGAGKTSLLNAAVIPDLENAGFRVVPPLRVIPSLVDPESGAESEEADHDQWSSENTHPDCRYADAAIDSLLGDPAVERVLGIVERPRNILDLATHVSHAEDPTYGDPVTTLFVFDQFEEILIPVDENWLDDQRQFFDQLAEMLDLRPDFRVVLAIREDNLGAVEQLADRLRGFPTRFRLPPLTPEHASEAIGKPSEETIPFEPSFLLSLVAELQLTRVQWSEHTVKSGAIEPARLQVVCRSLWETAAEAQAEKITEGHLKKVGGVSGAMRRYFDDNLAVAAKKGGVDEEELREFFGEQLITPVGTRQLVFAGLTNVGLPEPVLDSLKESGLIREEIRRGTRFWELSHDGFVAPVRESNDDYWAGLEERDSEHKRQRNRYLTTIGGVVLVLLAGFLIRGAFLLGQTADLVQDAGIESIVPSTSTQGEIALYDEDESSTWVFDTAEGGARMKLVITLDTPRRIYGANVVMGSSSDFGLSEASMSIDGQPAVPFRFGPRPDTRQESIQGLGVGETLVLTIPVPLTERRVEMAEVLVWTGDPTEGLE